MQILNYIFLILKKKAKLIAHGVYPQPESFSPRRQKTIILPFAPNLIWSNITTSFTPSFNSAKVFQPRQIIANAFSEIIAHTHAPTKVHFSSAFFFALHLNLGALYDLPMLISRSSTRAANVYIASQRATGYRGYMQPTIYVYIYMYSIEEKGIKGTIRRREARK